jgi:hypothetical protein
MADPAAIACILLDLVRVRVPSASQPGLEALMREPLADAFTVAARRVGKGALAPDPTQAARLAGAGLDWFVGGWGLDEAVRAALLLRAATAVPTDAELVDDVYRRGDSRERQAVLRCLALLPAPERYVPLAVEACRSSIQPLFEAIACENPYPAAHFPEPSFNQMVLKALFVGVPLQRILGLDARITDELRRMAADYASERRAAARPVPADIDHLLAEKETPA